MLAYFYNINIICLSKKRKSDRQIHLILIRLPQTVLFIKTNVF